MEHPLAVSNYFISKSFETGIEVTPMKVLKLVYIAHGWSLGLDNGPLITEAVQAWKYGPVVESVYHEFKHYGGGKITSLAYIFNVTPVTTSKENLKILDKVWEVYKDYDGLRLSTLTHQPGTPWDIAWNKMGGKKQTSVIIANDLIEEHYKQKVTKNKANA